MKRLWAVGREYGLSNDDMHALAMSELSEEHISRLSDDAAKYLIDRISGKNAAPPRRGMASNAQKKYITDLAHKLGWSENPQRLSGFIKKYAKTDNIDSLTAYKASKIIEGLKRMTEGV